MSGRREFAHEAGTTAAIFLLKRDSETDTNAISMLDGVADQLP